MYTNEEVLCVNVEQLKYKVTTAKIKLVKNFSTTVGT